MNDPKQVLTVAEQYREQLQSADDRDAIRERMEWYREQAGPLFKRGDA